MSNSRLGTRESVDQRVEWGLLKLWPTLSPSLQGPQRTRTSQEYQQPLAHQRLILTDRFGRPQQHRRPFANLRHFIQCGSLGVGTASSGPARHKLGYWKFALRRGSSNKSRQKTSALLVPLACCVGHSVEKRPRFRVDVACRFVNSADLDESTISGAQSESVPSQRVSVHHALHCNQQTQHGCLPTPLKRAPWLRTAAWTTQHAYARRYVESNSAED